MRTLAAAAAFLCAWACSDNTAASRCTADADCGAGRICDTGTCKAASTRTVGEACASDANCSIGSLCATSMPSGLCTYSCAGDTCPSGAVCTDLRASGSGIICASACAAPADCRSGYTCCPGLGACVPPASCPAQGRGASADLGKACPAGGCASGEICAGDPNPEFPGGACTAACNPTNQNTCPATSTCVSTSTGSFCFPSCTAPADCTAFGALSSCVAGACRSATASPSCTPPGTPAVVLGGTVGPATAPTTCDLAHAAPVRTPSWATAATQPFGVKTVGGTPVPFTLPRGVGSMSILSQGSNVPQSTITLNGRTFPNSVVPTLLTNPANSVIYDDLPVPPADGSGVAVFYGGFSPFTGMMTVPNTSFSLEHTALQGGLDPGTWKFTVNDFALECTQVTNCTPTTPPTNQYDVEVLLKPGLPSATGTVNLAFYFVGGAIASASAAQNDPAFTRMLQTLGKIYANGGLCLGTVTLYDVPQWAKDTFATLNADDESICGGLSQMFTLSASGNQINYFFVTNLTSTSAGGQVVGVDGTIPGPSSVGGNVSSGAAVNGSSLSLRNCLPGVTDISNCGADEVAYIAAHEGGHFMGLYHTTEMTGDSFDPLSDTATCACTSCAPANKQANCSPRNPSGTPPTLLFNDSCLRPTSTPQCGGGDNLMFWFFGAGSTGALSPHQGQVMRSNLVVR